MAFRVPPLPVPVLTGTLTRLPPDTAVTVNSVGNLLVYDRVDDREGQPRFKYYGWISMEDGRFRPDRQD